MKATLDVSATIGGILGTTATMLSLAAYIAELELDIASVGQAGA